MSLYVTGKRMMDMNAAQVHELYKLRGDVFTEEQQATVNDVDDIDIHPGTLHILAYETDGGLHLVGTARVYGKATDGQHIGRVCVARASRGQGIANKIMQKAWEVCVERAAGIDPHVGAAVHLSAQSYLEKWYSSFGFVTTGPEYEEAGLPHVPMTAVIRG